MLLTLLVASAGAGDETRARSLAQPVVDRFHAEVVRCGARPPFKPTLGVSAKPGVIRYDQPTGRIILFPWSTLDDKARREQAAAAKGGDGQSQYERVFLRWLVAHELGHWLQGFQPELRTAAGVYDGWAAEYHANQLMIAFWREHGPRGDRPAFIAWTTADADGPSPVPPPAGVSEQDFFNAETMTIVRGGAYGWYQGRMVRRAAAEVPRSSFCSLVGRWLPLR